MRTAAIAIVLAGCASFPPLPREGACVTGEWVRGSHSRYADYRVQIANQPISDDETSERMLAQPRSAPFERASQRLRLVAKLTLPGIALAVLLGVLVIPRHPTGTELALATLPAVLGGSAIGATSQIISDADHDRALAAYGLAARESGRCPP